MELYVSIRRNEYHDSLELLLATSILEGKDGIGKANVAMGNGNSFSIFRSLGLYTEEMASTGPTDLIVAAEAERREIFDKSVAETFEQISGRREEQHIQSCNTLEDALRLHGDAQVCVISLPGEYAKDEAMKALRNGLHVVLFSSHIAPEDELELKKYAASQGLLCMGPDCGVVNIDGTAFILSSITRPGPFGLCGATGVGIQHVGALIDRAGSGVTQIIGTGGADLKVGEGITMLSGIDALEDDPATEYIVLVSRKPKDEVLAKILERVKQCKKPVVGCFMGADPAVVEAGGAIYASDLDDAAVKALALIGKTCDLQTDEELDRLAVKAVQGMKSSQKYLRGLFTGGTYMEEAMRSIAPIAGPVHSNAPLAPELLLEDSLMSVENTCVDVGEDEFTMGKPHPTMEPSGRKPFIVKEGSDPEVCVLLLDFIFAVSANVDPVGVVLEDIQAAMANAQANGGKLAVVAALCGTDGDFQNYAEQKRKLEQAGVYVCQTNRLAAKLAAKIVALQNGGKV